MVGCHLPIQSDYCRFLLKVIDVMKGKLPGNKAAVVWLAICWSIWKQKNDIDFDGAECDIDELFLTLYGIHGSG